MPAFTKTIDTEYGNLNFYFNPIYTAEGVRYHVSAIAKDNSLKIFHLEPVGGSWRLVEKDSKQYWLIAIEQKLSEAILQREEYRDQK